MISVLLATAIAIQSVSQDSVTRAVTIGYALSGDEPAVVTLSAVALNGVNLTDGELLTVSGDVNRLLQPGEYTLVWQPPVTTGLSADSLNVSLKAWATNAPPDYMVINLAEPKRPVQYYTSAAAIPGGVTDRRYATDYLVMRRIPAAGVVWRMGSPDNEASRGGNEQTHYVKLNEDYYLAVYPTTIRQYRWLNGKMPSESYIANTSVKLATMGAYDWDAPVTGFSYASLRGNLHRANCTLTGESLNVPFAAWPQDGRAIAAAGAKCSVCGASNDPALRRFRDNWPGFLFDIPTEAQWEFACRGGSQTYEALPGSPASPRDIAWYCVNSTNGLAETKTCVPRPVGRKLPNGYGLYDMLGNICEWTLDYYGSYPSGTAVAVDPEGPIYPKIRDDNTHQRVLRGSTYFASESSIRTSIRSPINAYYSNVTPNNCGSASTTSIPSQSSGFRLWLPCHAVR